MSSTSRSVAKGGSGAGKNPHARATVTEIQAERRRVVSTTVCSVEDKVLLDGEATMMDSNRPT